MTDINKRAMEILMTTTGADEAELAAAMTEPDHPDNTVDVLDAIAAVEAAMREPVRRVTDEMVERGAEGHWNVASHKMLEKGGFPTDWASQPESVKRDYRKYSAATLKAALGQEKAHVG